MLVIPAKWIMNLLLYTHRKIFFFLPLSVTNGTSHSPTALNGAPSSPNGFSNGPSSSSSSSLANQQLPPACGARQLSKLKRFLTTLQQFGNDISPEIGDRVRTLVLGLVVSLYTHTCAHTLVWIRMTNFYWETCTTHGLDFAEHLKRKKASRSKMIIGIMM